MLNLNKLNKNYFYITVIILFGIALRYLYFMNVDAWFDEWNALYTVDPNISNEDTWKRYYGDRGDYYILPEYYPPIFAFLLKGFLSIFGYTVENSRLFTIIFGSGSLFLSFYLAKIFLNLKYSLISTSLLSLNLFLIWQSSEIRPHSFVVFFSLLSIIYFLKILSNKLSNSKIHTAIYVFSSIILLSTWPFALTIFFSKIVFLIHKFLIDKKINFILCLYIIIILISYLVINNEYLLYHLAREEHYTKLYQSFFYSYHFRSFFGSVFLGGVFLIIFVLMIVLNLKKIILKSEDENLLLFIILFSYFLTIIYSIISAPVISPKYIIFILPLIVIWSIIKIKNYKSKFENYYLIFLIFITLSNCMVNFKNITIDRPPTKEALQKISESQTKNILSPDGTVFINFVKINQIFIENNLLIYDSRKDDFIKQNFWFLCLNNPRFAAGENNFPDEKKCMYFDNTDKFLLKNEIEIEDYILKEYEIK